MDVATAWITLLLPFLFLSFPIEVGFDLSLLEILDLAEKNPQDYGGKIWLSDEDQDGNCFAGTSAFALQEESTMGTNSRDCNGFNFVWSITQMVGHQFAYQNCATSILLITAPMIIEKSTRCYGPTRSEKSIAQNLAINFLASIYLFTRFCLKIFNLFLSLKNKKFAKRLTVGPSIDNKQEIGDNIGSDCIGSSEQGNYSCKNETKDKQAQFSIEDIITITNNYECRIGEGGFGIVYHGLLPDSEQVAVKLFKFPDSETIIDQFANEVELLMKVKHENLVPFYGYCDDSTNKAIICKFISGGDLKKHLTVPSSNSTALILDWIRRLKIALGTARGLKYLHEELHIVHRDVKPENIFLDESFEPKIADFGFSLLFTEAAATRVVTEHVIGTLGYIDPEYYRTNTLSYRSDVYSFGVILLQLITGKPAILMVNNTQYEKIHLTHWVNQRSNLDAIVDPSFGGNFHRMSVKQALDLAKRCTKLNSTDRPTMKEVTSEVEILLKIENSRQK